MQIAVLTLTRDRVEYTRHCFASLRENAGCAFDHFILDQASEDDTLDFLADYLHAYDGVEVVPYTKNIGIHYGHNTLLEMLEDAYDVVVTFDNDCEVTEPGTLAACARIVSRGAWILSPTVQGLNFPPQPAPAEEVDGELVGRFHAIGGIFRAMPGWFADEFRFDDSMPYWGGDERAVGAAAEQRGLSMGYLLDWHVNHYETTRGQEARYPSYFSRKHQELAG